MTIFSLAFLSFPNYNLPMFTKFRSPYENLPPPRIALKNSGFTLVELMVVVAIIGILAAVGIPSFKKYQAKSKTVEARTQLAAVYAAETTFQAEFDTYAACLKDMGYDPSAERANRYYMMWTLQPNSIPSDTALANGAPSCDGGGGPGMDQFYAGKAVGGYIASWDNCGGLICGGMTISFANPQPGITGDGAGFSAAAAGYVSSPVNAGGFDYWMIDQNKNLTHVKVGY